MLDIQTDLFLATAARSKSRKASHTMAIVGTLASSATFESLSMLRVGKRPLSHIATSKTWYWYGQRHSQQELRFNYNISRWLCSSVGGGGGGDNTPPSSYTDSGGESRSMMLYNTLSGKVEPLSSSTTTVTSKGLAWYTCGPTTYAPAHLGHARTYVCLDIIRRVLVDSVNTKATTNTPTTTDLDSSIPRQPLFVLNITDIDDKIIAAAASASATNYEAEGKDSSTGAVRDAVGLARYWEKEFWNDWDELNCLRPHVVTRVTEHVESDIVPFIERLVDSGLAYEISSSVDSQLQTSPSPSSTNSAGDADGVYFDVRAFNDICGARTKYGKLAPPAAAQDIPNVFENIKDINNESDDDMPIQYSTTTTQSRRNKRDPRDFALWKKTCNTSESSAGTVAWPSPWGYGRPGWHIECSAMIQAVQERFQDSYEFQVHAGGVDLKFPHHTNEIAQSEAYCMSGIDKDAADGTKKEWIPHWVHTGHLHIDGLKMSKSLKNFVTIREFLDGKILGSSQPEQQQQQEVKGEDGRPVGDGGAFESPSDDFRLWCLGLSGSYRGPATFSVDRMKEARSIRYKILRFLIESEEWIRQLEESSENMDERKSKHFATEDYELFHTCEDARRTGLEALRMHDLDGAEFITQLCRMVEAGNEYIKKRKIQSSPSEPLIAVIQDVRKLLRLVGFTATTTEAGLRSTDETTKSFVVGGERALMDVLVQFRSVIRRAALREVRSPNSSSSPAVQEILRVSDEIRDTILPGIGLQLLDGDGGSDEQQDGWMLCLPQSQESTEKQNDDRTLPTKSNSTNLSIIPLADFFKVGKYEEQFSAYTEDGIPTHNADGTEVSKRLHQKLMKKRRKHQERLQAKKSQ